MLITNLYCLHLLTSVSDGGALSYFVASLAQQVAPLHLMLKNTNLIPVLDIVDGKCVESQARLVCKMEDGAPEICSLTQDYSFKVSQK